ncbi:AbiJ-NTD4 domain-containing protein [Chitinimonas sp. PSY-7]|uniref:AbiJ-NTD4 domain-containing protein n=1 Tax=Chitinimonas sp. PSY-7 TaxID=3459088 RepID=UPI00404025F0
MDTFSRRHGLSRPDADILIRYEAPDDLRNAIVDLAYQCGFKPSDLRRVLCSMLYRTPDRNNWSDFPNVDDEVRDLISDCEWFEVYDLIELLAQSYARNGGDFAGETNRMFRIKGVGWQLVGTRLEVRGSEAFELAVKEGQRELLQRGSHTAANELHEAILDLSRRPNPEVSGAIQHAMAALECVARDVCVSKDTLGDVLRKNPHLFPKPVDQIVDKAWGYTSNYGRHLVEGSPPAFDEAELVVGLAGALARYLSRRFPKSSV